MATEKEAKPKVKRPTPLKRDARAEKMRLINKSFKSNVRSTLRSFEEALKTTDKARIQGALNTVYSVMDKGVKRGIFKANKASRLKSRATQKLTAENKA